jgi:hypothetical protein
VKGYRRSQSRALAHLVLAALLTSGLACDEDPAGPPDVPPPGIVGTVLDADSVAVAGAPVGLIYGIHQGQDGWPPVEFGEGSPQPIRETFVLRFTLSEASTVRLLLQDFRYRPRRVLIDGQDLVAGEHEVHFDWTDDDGLPLPNGLYGTRLEITRPGFSDVQESGGLLRNTLSLEFGTEVGALVTTDADGSFRIPYGELPIGEWSYCWDGEDGICTIPDTLWIQSAAGGFGARRLLRIDDLEADLPVTLRWAQRRD